MIYINHFNPNATFFQDSCSVPMAKGTNEAVTRFFSPAVKRGHWRHRADPGGFDRGGCFVARFPMSMFQSGQSKITYSN